MGDSWEDEDFDVPVVPVVKKANWDDEEDEADLASLDVQPAVQTPEMIARLAKKAEEDAVKLANKLKFAALEKEAPEDRKMRERRLIEEADNELSAELFADATRAATASSSLASTSVKPVVSKAATLAGISVATKQDHINLGNLVAKKLDSSTSFNIAAFFDTFAETIQNKLSVESLDKCLETLKKIRADRDEKVAKKMESKKTKLAVKAEKKKHEEVFGGANYEEDYADYAGIEDDFM